MHRALADILRGSALVLLAATLGASYLPARAAARGNPVAALKTE